MLEISPVQADYTAGTDYTAVLDISLVKADYTAETDYTAVLEIYPVQADYTAGTDYTAVLYISLVQAVERGIPSVWGADRLCQEDLADLVGDGPC